MYANYYKEIEIEKEINDNPDVNTTSVDVIFRQRETITSAEFWDIKPKQKPTRGRSYFDFIIKQQP